MEKADTTKISIERRTTVIVAEKLGLLETDFTLQSNFTEDLHVDSLDMVEVIKSFEKEFEVSISQMDVYRMTTVALAIDIIFAKYEKGIFFDQSLNK